MQGGEEQILVSNADLKEEMKEEMKDLVGYSLKRESPIIFELISKMQSKKLFNEEIKEILINRRKSTDSRTNIDSRTILDHILSQSTNERYRERIEEFFEGDNVDVLNNLALIRERLNDRNILNLLQLLPEINDEFLNRVDERGILLEQYLSQTSYNLLHYMGFYNRYRHVFNKDNIYDFLIDILYALDVFTEIKEYITFSEGEYIKLCEINKEYARENGISLHLKSLNKQANKDLDKLLFTIQILSRLFMSGFNYTENTGQEIDNYCRNNGDNCKQNYFETNVLYVFPRFNLVGSFNDPIRISPELSSNHNFKLKTFHTNLMNDDEQYKSLINIDMRYVLGSNKFFESALSPSYNLSYERKYEYDTFFILLLQCTDYNSIIAMYKTLLNRIEEDQIKSLEYCNNKIKINNNLNKIIIKIIYDLNRNYDADSRPEVINSLNNNISVLFDEINSDLNNLIHYKLRLNKDYKINKDIDIVSLLIHCKTMINNIKELDKYELIKEKDIKDLYKYCINLGDLNINESINDLCNKLLILEITIYFGIFYSLIKYDLNERRMFILVLSILYDKEIVEFFVDNKPGIFTFIMLNSVFEYLLDRLKLINDFYEKTDTVPRSESKLKGGHIIKIITKYINILKDINFKKIYNFIIYTKKISFRNLIQCIVTIPLLMKYSSEITIYDISYHLCNFTYFINLKLDIEDNYTIIDTIRDPLKNMIIESINIYSKAFIEYHFRGDSDIKDKEKISEVNEEINYYWNRRDYVSCLGVIRTETLK